MRQKKGTFFSCICHFLITGRVVLHKKFYKKFHLPVIKNGRLFRQKLFLVAGFIILGVKNEHFFDWFQSKKKNYLLIQKIILWHFLCDKKKGTFFFQNSSHFLITGRVVLHKKFYKKFHLPVIKNGRLFRQKNFFWWLDLLFSGWKNEHFSIDFNRKWNEYLLIQKDNSLTFFMRQRRERFFQNSHFLITGRVVLHKKFYKKFHLPVIKNGRLFRQKTSFGGWIYYSRGEKMNIFSIDFNRKSEELSFNSKDNSLTFLCDKKKGTFFSQNSFHFLITGRVVLHKKFYKKFHLPVIKNGRLFRQKNFFWWLDLLFSGWKKWTFFRLISIESEELSFNSKDNSLTFFYATKEGNVFFKICHFLITGRVVLHKKFYKKFHLPVIKNGRLFRQKNFWWLDLLFSGWKNEHFSIDFNRKWRIIFNSKKIILWHFFCDKKKGTFFSGPVTFW